MDSSAATKAASARLQQLEAWVKVLSYDVTTKLSTFIRIITELQAFGKHHTLDIYKGLTNSQSNA